MFENIVIEGSSHGFAVSAQICIDPETFASENLCYWKHSQNILYLSIMSI